MLKLLIFVTLALTLCEDLAIKNKEINKKIDLSHTILYITTDISVEKGHEIREYSYLVPRNNSKSLINIKAQSKGNQLPMIKKSENEEYVEYIISVGDSTKFTVHEHHFEKLKFLPRKITLKEDQYELYEDYQNTLSPYSTESQKTTVILPSESTIILSYTTKNAKKSGSRITYELEDVSPLSKVSMRVHYVNNKPLMVFSSAAKTYQVSHWGNIAVTEEYKIANIGAELTGEFGRLDYDEYGRRGGKNAFTQIKATLPLRSWGLWYRDEIGNVSTSVAKREWNNVDLTLNPRFPILGGWKSFYDIGYNLPSKFHVTTNGKGNYMVNVTFGMPYNDMLARNYKVKIVLPEGADNVKVNLPIDKAYKVEEDKEYGCLDLFGRKAVIITLNDMYDEFKTDVLVTYDYTNGMLFVKPFILMFYFVCIFMFIIFCSRADLTLHRKQEKEKED